MASISTLNRKVHYVGVNPPSGDYNDMVNKPAINGVVLTSSTTKADLGLDTIYNYKGQVATYDDLPSSGNHVGDVWNVVDTGENYAWNEDDEWDKLTGADAVYFRNNQLESNGVALSIDANKNEITNLKLEDISDVTATADEVNILDGATIDVNELNTLDGVESNVQTQLNAKLESSDLKTVNGNSLVGEGNITIDSLPSQTGQSGKFLTTDGTNASWATLDAALNGTTAPTNATVGSLGQIYVDTVADEGYVCTNINSNVYTWRKITYTPSSTTITLLSASWNTSTKEYTIPVVGMTATTTVWIAPSVSADNSNEELYATYGVRGKSQSTGSLVMACNTVPPEDIDIEIIM